MEIWYHGTSKWEEILRSGVNIDAPRPTADTGDFGWGFYLTKRLGRAKNRGKVLQIIIDPSRLAYISNPYSADTRTPAEQLFTALAFQADGDKPDWYQHQSQSLRMLTVTGTKQEREAASKRIQQEFLAQGYQGIITDYEDGEAVLFSTEPILDIRLLQRRNPDSKKFEDWFAEVLPAIIFQHIVLSRAVKVCSSISPIFAMIARHYGYQAYVLAVPGHYMNVVITEKGPLQIDLSAIQFKLGEFVREEDITDFDPYGVDEAIDRAIRFIIRNPWRAIRIQNYHGSVEILREPEINDYFRQYYLDSFENSLRTVDWLRQKDPKTLEVFSDIKYLDEWESESGLES